MRQKSTLIGRRKEGIVVVIDVVVVKVVLVVVVVFCMCYMNFM